MQWEVERRDTKFLERGKKRRRKCTRVSLVYLCICDVSVGEAVYRVVAQIKRAEFRDKIRKKKQQEKTKKKMKKKKKKEMPRYKFEKCNRQGDRET